MRCGVFLVVWGSGVVFDLGDMCCEDRQVGRCKRGHVPGCVMGVCDLECLSGWGQAGVLDRV